MTLDQCNYKQIEWGTKIQGEGGSVKKLKGFVEAFLSFQPRKKLI
jgi:hypothetical protein